MMDKGMIGCLSPNPTILPTVYRQLATQIILS